MDTTGFRLPRVHLPRPGIDLAKWAVVACDQYTSEPDYWHRVERDVGDAPSTLHLIYPEAFLGAGDSAERIARIQQTMRRYLDEGLLVEHEGAILVERTLDDRMVGARTRRGSTRTRRGLMLELDLEHYDFRPGSTSLIRPTEGTIVERLAPRIEVRRDAELELPHILVLIDDPERTVIEPIAAARDALAPLYATALMQGGGHVAGYAVAAAATQRAVQALRALGGAQTFAARHGVTPDTPPMLFAVGDGNHSLATAKSIWERVKGSVGMQHPSRWALVEVENIHDPALAFEPIHRVLFGVRADVRRALADTFGARLSCTDVASGDALRERVHAATRGTHHAFGLISPGPRFSLIEIADPPSTLAVGTVQPVVDKLVEQGAATHVDYVHGYDVLERLALEPGNAGIHLAPVDKSDLLRMVVREGVLPRKTFSMGEAHEKRFYVEARRIR